MSEFGRDNVARIGIDSEQTAAVGFQRTEGIKTVGVNNFGNTVEVDLYLDPAWENTAVRAGLWVVGDEGDARSNTFGIIEFVNSEDCASPDCTTHPSNITDHEGFRLWDSLNGGWSESLELDTEFEYGNWVTLKIELDAEQQQYVYTINDGIVGTAGGGGDFIREVFLNSYNYGLDEFPMLNSDSYAAHWHGGLMDPAEKNDCKKDGFVAFGFKNQGQCIQYVNTGRDSR